MRTYLNAIIFAVAIIVTALILSAGFRNRNASLNTISVTGLGSKDFVSDLIVWSGSFFRKNMDLRQAYSELDKDREIIRNYLLSKGIRAEQFVFSSVDINKEVEDIYDARGVRVRQDFTGYRLRQSVSIESSDVDRVEELSRQVSELINSGVEFYSNNPQYYYTKLSALKIEMIAEATKDANTRARRIAENAGAGIGRLKNADMGVFQIVAQNSAEEYSWGGSFNTTSKRKTASITVKLEYETD
ncbi:MAG TPA: SIMPL domain-containing protein [Flavisolibacter sp.]